MEVVRRTRVRAVMVTGVCGADALPLPRPPVSLHGVCPALCVHWGEHGRSRSSCGSWGAQEGNLGFSDDSLK